MIIIENIQNNATVTDGNNTVTLGAGDSYTCSEPEEKLDLIITVDTTISDVSPSDSYILPWLGTPNCLVRWGDGAQQYLNSSNVSSSSNITHQYAIGGIYDITISGSFTFRANSSSVHDKKKLTAIKQWGKGISASFNASFSSAINLTSVPQNETLKFRSGDFRSSFSDIPISNFGKIDSSIFSITQKCFKNTNFDYNIGDWNMFNCSNMQDMFAGTSMSVANCDAIFTGWTRWNNGQANLQLQSNVSIHMGNTDYTRGGDAEDAFNYLVNTLNWTITFG